MRPGTRTFIMQDRARLLSDGALEYLGRADRVVKIRGLRADLEELERTLCARESVNDAAVTTHCHDIDGTRLVAFVVPAPGIDSSTTWTSRLQAIMRVPCRVVAVKEVPRLGSGKIDRIQLARQAADALAPESTAKGGEILCKLHRELGQIWESILDARPVGLADDFFALGGDSLMATTMLAAVEKNFGVNLPVATLIDRPTLQEFGDAIAQNPSLLGGDTLVGLRRNGSRSPLFCVPSAGSNVFEFRLLAAHLPDDQPIFSFQSPGLDGRTCCLRSVSEMAEFYLAALREQQPRGPYHLCGSSFGGVIAFEMAQKLLERNEVVSFLGLLDSHICGYPRPRKRLGLSKRVQLAMTSLLPHGRRNGRFTLGNFRSGFAERVRRWLVRQCLRIDWLFDACVMSYPFDWRGLYVQEACFGASKRYQPKPFAGKIDLFRSEDQPRTDLFEDDPFLGWGEIARGGIEVHELPGYHSMYLRDSDIIAVLARQLTDCLNFRR